MLFDSPSRSDEDNEDDDEIRVIWKTGPTQRPRTRPPAPPQPRPSTSTDSPRTDCNSTPKPKRSTTLAGLPSPSVPLSSSERPQRVAKQKKTKRRACFASKKQEVPMDASTLQLVSQLAMKVQARSQPGYETPLSSLSSTSERRKEVQGASSRIGNRTVKDGPNSGRLVEPKTNGTQPVLSSPRIRFSSTKSSISAAKESPARQKQPLPHSKSPPLVNPKTSPLHQKPPQVVPQKEEEEDFDSYFDDFVDESFELALSQLDDIGSTKTCDTSPMFDTRLNDGTESCGRVEEGKEVEGRELRSASTAKLDVVELARREIESLGDLSAWDEDDFWIDD